MHLSGFLSLLPQIVSFKLKEINLLLQILDVVILNAFQLCRLTKTCVQFAVDTK